MRVSVSIPDNVSGLLEAAMDESIEQLKTSKNFEWFNLSQKIQAVFEESVAMGGLPKEPVPRGRKSAMLKGIAAGEVHSE